MPPARYAKRDDKSGDDKIDLAINTIVFNMKDGKFASAIDQLRTIYRVGTYDRDRVDIAILRRISQYHTLQKNPQKVFELIRELPDPQVQEAAMYLMSARAVVEDKGPELYKLTSPDRMQRTLTYTERAARWLADMSPALRRRRKPRKFRR